MFRVQCFGEVGDSYALLGGNRLDDAASTTSSFKCEIVSATKLRLTAFYPGQRSTEQHVYLRCAQQNNGIETAVLSDATGPPVDPLALVAARKMVKRTLASANKELLAELQPVIDPLGNEVVVVLCNPTRLKSGKSRAGYCSAFLMRDNPHPDWRGGLLYRKYPNQYLLGVAKAGGSAVVHGRSDERPSLEVIEAGFAKVKDDKSLLGTAGGIFSAAGAAAALERRNPQPEEQNA